MNRTLIVVVVLALAAGCNLERKSRAQASFEAWWATLDQTEQDRIRQQQVVWNCPGLDCSYQVELTDTGRTEPGADLFVRWWNSQDPAVLEAWIRQVNAEKMQNMRGKVSDEVIREYLTSTATFRPLKLEFVEADK